MKLRLVLLAVSLAGVAFSQISTPYVTQPGRMVDSLETGWQKVGTTGTARTSTAFVREGAGSLELATSAGQ
jgi:hypothetical protein